MDKGLGNESSSSEMFLRQLNKNSVKIAKPIRKPVTDYPNNPPQSHQPPVYNIDKDDFRDVVQKLTGSPAHERLPPPPVAAASASRLPSSRLQRIRPPPLAQIGQLAPILPRPSYDSGPSLPPLPSVHMAAESPISAYMRYIQGSASPLAPAESPVSAHLRFFRNSVGSSSGYFPAVMPFGCVPSPRSPYGMKSSRFIFSPTGLAPQLPLSPTGSPMWKGM